MTAASEKYQQAVFAVERRNLDSFHSQLTIFTTAAAQARLTVEQNIVEGYTESFFSGTTEIQFRPLSEMDMPIVRYYFSGSKEEVVDIRQFVYARLATSYVHKESTTGSEVFAYAAWGLALCFLALLTWLDIQFSRKAFFLKISMGASVWGMIWCRILTDLCAYTLLFGGAYVCLEKSIFLSYKIGFILPAFAGFCVFNSFLNCIFARSNYKEIMYGANIDSKLLANTYFIKALVLILLIVSVTCNVGFIRTNASWLRVFHKVDALQGYHTLSVWHDGGVLVDETAAYTRETRLFQEAYQQDKVLMATQCSSLSDGAGEQPVILLNKVALGRVVSNPEYFQKPSASFVVYVPEQKLGSYDSEELEGLASVAAASFFGYDYEEGVRWSDGVSFLGAEQYSYEVCSYPTVEVLYFDLRGESSNLPYGFEQLSNPVIVYCNVTPAQLDAAIKAGARLHSGLNRSLMFEVDDSSFFSKEATQGLEEITFNSVVEQCGQHRNTWLRLLLMNTTVSVLLLVLSIVLISVIVKLEYLINARELALKRVLGYSVLQRNSATVLLNLFSLLIAFVTGWILSSMYALFEKPMLCLVSVAICLFDTGVTVANMAVAEHKNTASVLKGGCL